jgi:hypothetical protein
MTAMDMQLLVIAVLLLGIVSLVFRRLSRPAAPTVPFERTLPTTRPSLTTDQRLARLEGQVSRLMQELGIEDDGKVPADSLQERIRPLIRADQKIQAIKVVREQTGLGLKEAKDYVDDLAARMQQGG